MSQIQLNSQQLKAVQTTSGPVLVVAGAGSGKTRALTARIAFLLTEKKVSPQHILAITFTNKATNEMRERLTEADPMHQLTISTFHAFCAKLLRQYIAHLDGYSPYFTIYNDDDRTKVLKKIITALNLEPADVQKNADFHISNAKNLGLNPEEYGKEFIYAKNIDQMVTIFEQYEQTLKQNNALDFDDLLVKTYQLLSQFPAVLQDIQQRYTYVHVDEFQDTNLVQYKILRLLCAKECNLFVVGDEDQCIYGWRGASIENTSLFLKDFDPVTVIKLEQNYRSTKKVLEYANKLIVNNKVRTEKMLWTDNDDGEQVHFYKAYSEQDEADYVVRQVYEYIHQGIDPSEIAILFRMGALSRLFEERLLNYNIPYTLYGAFKFYERVEIRNILSYFWLLYNPKDNEAFKRIINYPRRGIGKTGLDHLEQESIMHQESMLDIALQAQHYDLPNPLKNKLHDFKEVFEDLATASQSLTMSQQFTYLLSHFGILEQYDKKEEEDNDRLLNIGQLQSSIQTFEENNPNTTMMDFLQGVTLQNEQQDTTDTGVHTVKVSTVHAVKGLEFDCVFIVGAEENLFPISRAFNDEKDMEEERRLMYVAITRSKRHLTFTCAESRYLYQSRSTMIPSRFLKEMGLVKESPLFQMGYGYGYRSGAGNNKPAFGGVDSEGFGFDPATVVAPVTGNSPQKMNNYTGTGMQFGSNLQAVMAKKLEKQSKNFDAFTIGTQVLHPKFGVGIIIKSYLEQGNNSVDVQFVGFGVKCLNLEFAPLQILKAKE